MEKFDINPFDRSALKDYKLMAGRADEFKQIRFILRKAAKNKNRFGNILISGDRGVGKTSFLNLIEAECESNNLIPIRLNLTETNTKNSNEFFWTLFSQTITEVFRLGLFGGIGGEIDMAIQRILNEEKLPDAANWVFNTPIQHKYYRMHGTTSFEFDKLIDDLRRIRQTILDPDNKQFSENTKLLFLVDESHHLYSKEAIIQEIRFIIQDQEIGIGFVFAGDNSYQTNMWEKVFGGSYRDFEVIKLEYFKDADDVISFFKKSLTSINWTDEEIEEKLFYKFHRTCLNIYQLTSGKPEWINLIAAKMFDRLMKGDVDKLKFDKETQKEVKILLENSGKLDREIINFIESLLPKYRKWLSKIVSSQHSYLELVYRFAKFQLIDDNFLDIEEFRNFSRLLIEKKILVLLEAEVEERSTIGYLSKNDEVDILKVPYYTFGTKYSAIKPWLQISSDGFYKFGFIDPGKLFFMDINEQLSSEENVNTHLLGIDYKEITENVLKLSTVIQQINDNTFNVEEEDYGFMNIMYKTCKKVAKSSERFALSGLLIDHLSGNCNAFIAYNYDEKGKLTGYHDSQIIKNRFIKGVERYNDDNTKLTLELTIEKLEKPNIERLQEKILLSNDKRKLGIIKEDKMEDLIEHYVKQSDKKSSLAEALFFYKLFEDGNDLEIRELNNAAYVFLAENEFEKADEFYTEGKRRIKRDLAGKEEMETEQKNSACLILYNSAILEFRRGNKEKALKEFKMVIKYLDEKDGIDDRAQILNLLEINAENDIIVSEIKEGNKDYPIISCKLFTEKNIRILEEQIN